MNYDVTSHVLPLRGALNARDLGNYPIAGGHKTREDVFFRSDSTSKFVTDDIAFLAHKNLGLVMDLRSEQEVVNAPSVYAGMESIRYENVQMLDDLNSGPSADGIPPSLGSIYMHLLDSAQSGFLKIFNAFAETLLKKQSCLFHCAVGKDRTGTTAMLLLDLVGASDEVIIADYAVSYELMKPLFDGQMAEYRARGYNIPDHMFRSDASNMEEALTHLRSVYGSAERYLLKCGVSQEYLGIITDAFIE